MREMIANLLNMKAECEKKFTEEEAAYDLATSDRVQQMSQRELAKRWGWSKSTVNRKLTVIKLEENE